MKSTVLFRSIILLICSNTFMTFARYAHLRNWNDKKWYVAALLSWGIALFLPFAFFYMHQSMKLDYVWAGVCLLGAVYLHVSVLKVFPC